jgi:hypothetical protein
MGTPYQEGMRRGGQIDPSEISLEESAQLYQYEMNGLKDLKPPYPAEEHVEYMQGWLEGARQVFQR